MQKQIEISGCVPLADFAGSLEAYSRRFPTRGEARCYFAYIETFYNHVRRHSSQTYLSSAS